VSWRFVFEKPYYCVFKTKIKAMALNVCADPQTVCITFTFDNVEECVNFLRFLVREPEFHYFQVDRMTETQVLLQANSALPFYALGVKTAAMWAVDSIIVFHPDQTEGGTK
jgi:hypothetical protein